MRPKGALYMPATGIAAQPSRPRRAVASVGLNLALAVGGLLVALVLLEVLIRVFDPQLLYRYPKGLFVNDAVIDYRLTPGFSGRLDTPEYSTEIHINAAGLRDSREVGSKPPGTRRILVLGDSFVMGHSVEERENFTRLVEDGLNAAAGSPIFSVLSSGVPGYSTREELAYLKSRGFVLDPDAVVLAFFIGNDVTDNADTNRHYKVVDGYLTSGVPASGALPATVQSFLALHSQLYHVLWPIQHRLRGLPTPQKTDDLLALCRTDGEPRLWQPTESLLSEMAATVREHGLPFFVVLIPDLVQVDPSLWSRATQDRDGLAPSDPSQRLTAIADAHQIPVLDLYPPLRAAAAGEPLYFPIDHHFTRAGNRVAADALTPFLWNHLSKLD